MPNRRHGSSLAALLACMLGTARLLVAATALAQQSPESMPPECAQFAEAMLLQDKARMQSLAHPCAEARARLEQASRGARPGALPARRASGEGGTATPPPISRPGASASLVVAPNLAGVDVDGFHIGMTRDEAVAACNAWGGTPFLHYENTVGFFRPNAPPPAGAKLRSMTCGGGRGLFDLALAPGGDRVDQVLDTATKAAIGGSTDAYIERLAVKYGRPHEVGPPVPIDRAAGTYARSVTWQVPVAGTPCAARASGGAASAAVKGGPCAAHVSVRVASDASAAFEADFELRALPTLEAYVAETSAGQGQTQLGRGDDAAGKADPADDAQGAAMVAPTLALARRNNVDLGVFGVRLGERLNLHECVAEGASEPCIPTAKTIGDALFGALHTLAITGGEAPEAPGIVNVSVRIPDARCPPWADCSLVVATRHGYAVAISFLTRYSADRQNEIEAILTAKYKQAPTSKSTFSECRVSYGGTTLGASARAANRLWQLPGLLVYYVPYGSPGSCAQGGIVVQTSAYRSLVQQADDAQPKM